MKIKNNFLVVSNYNNDISWIKEYTDNFIIYDRSDTTIDPSKFGGKVIKQKNVGYNLYDYFTFIIDNYENLPECTIFAKGNIFPRHISREHFEKIMNNNYYTPIEEREKLSERWPIAFYSKRKGYTEINNSWYTKYFNTKYFDNYNEFLKFCFGKIKNPIYISFAPGANYIVPREYILKFPKQFYINLKLIISYTKLPGEAHIIERALSTIWKSNQELSEEIIKPVDENKLMNKLKNNGADTMIIRNLKIFYLLVKDIYKKIKLPFQEIKQNVERKKWPAKSEIKDFRKKIKVYDIFNFFNELELLDIRLNILDPYVDYFVIVESSLTHAGKPKELYFEKNKHLFDKFNHKIIHYVIKDPLIDFKDAEDKLNRSDIPEYEKDIIRLGLNSNAVPKGMPHYLRDFYEKESVKNALVGLNDDDFCYISDLDEIWNPEIVINYKTNLVYKFRQIAYYYFLNNRSNESWVGTTALRYGILKDKCINDIRSINKTRHFFVKNGGWHFTYQGGADRVKQKIESFSHQEFNNSETKDKIESKLANNKDIVGRKFKFWIDESELPEYLTDNKEKYMKLFK